MNNYMYTSFRTVLTSLAVFACTHAAVAQFTWTSAGPIYTSGRARAMVVDRNNNSVLYVGSASGGIFKSTDAGANWVPLDDKKNTVRNISYIAQSIDGTIYAATGEGFLSYGQKVRAQPGTGLYRLEGDELKNVVTAATVGTVINRVACSPANASNIALATNLGVWVSFDAGATWNAAPTPSVVANARYGMDVKFDNSGILYCSIGNEKGGSPSLNNIAGLIYKSTDNTLMNFTAITPTSNVLDGGNYGRIELAIAPSNNNVIYASCANKNLSTTVTPMPHTPNLMGLFVSTDGGNSWELIIKGAAQLDPLSNGGSLATGDYAHVLTVNPGNPHQLFMGGYSAYVFNASSSNPSVGTWTQLGNRFAMFSPLYLHENIHDIRIIPGNPAKFYFITDAGIYRSTDMVSISQNVPPSFQAVYKGLVTGQFNSVSADRYPLTTSNVGTSGGQVVEPRFGYVGGTGGNGLVYYSGSSQTVSDEQTYVGGEIYNAEYSKLLPDAVYFSAVDGKLYRTSNVKKNNPARVTMRSYSGALATIAPNDAPFENQDVGSGTSFKLWENYGQVTASPDSMIFYNDTVVVQASMSGLATLTTQTTFTFQAGRLNRFARIDSISFRTATVTINSTGQNAQAPFTAADKKDIRVNVLNEVVVPTTTISVPVQNGSQIQYLQTYSGTNVAVTGTAAASSTAASVEMNHTSLLDLISVTFSSAPFANKTQTQAAVPDPAAFYRVMATIYYRYEPGDTISMAYEDITTKETVYKTVLTKTVRWAYGSVNPSVLVNGFVPASPHNSPVAFKGGASARIAMHLDAPATNNNPAVVVSKAPLNLNDPMSFVRVSASGAYKDDASGNPTTTKISLTGRPNLVEWSKSGSELYYSTTDNKVYRVSHLTRLMDMSPSSYSGKINTDIFTYVSNMGGNVNNPNSPYRTTLIGDFKRPVTSLSTNGDGSKLLVTLSATGTGTTPTVLMNTTDVRVSDVSNQVWVAKDASSTGVNVVNKSVYCALIEMHDENKVFLGTDNGLVYTDNITANPPSWQMANNDQLPSVQVFDIDQQTLPHFATYNSGEIYVATNGRGVWSNRSYFNPYIVDVQEQENIHVSVENNLTMFPNPSSGQVTIGFGSVTNENAVLQVMDLSGRSVYTESLGKLNGADYTHSFDTGKLSSGIYIVNIASDSGVQRVSKLVVAK